MRPVCINAILAGLIVALTVAAVSCLMELRAATTTRAPAPSRSTRTPRSPRRAESEVIEPSE